MGGAERRGFVGDAGQAEIGDAEAEVTGRASALFFILWEIPLNFLQNKKPLVKNVPCRLLKVCKKFLI